MKTFIIITILSLSLLVACGGSETSYSPTTPSVSNEGPSAPGLPGQEVSGDAVPVGQAYVGYGEVLSGAASWASYPVDLRTDGGLVRISDEEYVEGDDSQTFTFTVDFPNGIVYPVVHFYGANGWVLDDPEKPSEGFTKLVGEQMWGIFYRNGASVEITIPRDELHPEGENMLAFFACAVEPGEDAESTLDDIVKCGCRINDDDEEECKTWTLDNGWDSKPYYWYVDTFYSTDNPDNRQDACESEEFVWTEGFGGPCCGDDDEEFANGEKLGILPPSDLSNANVCCPAISDCVYDGECYAEDDSIHAEGYTSLCVDGDWVDLDDDPSLCTDVDSDFVFTTSGEPGPHGSFADSGVEMCCGDDPEEVAAVEVGERPASATGDVVCCSGFESCVYDGECYDGTSLLEVDNEVVAHCDVGEWKDLDTSEVACDNAGHFFLASGEDADHGEYTDTTTTMCCGDDPEELALDSTLDDTSACCTGPDRVVVDGVCKDPNPAGPAGPGSVS